MGFIRTLEAADLFSKTISCANPQCRQQSDHLQNLGSACKHSFCWDCINAFSRQDTLCLCPMCACPLELGRIMPAQLLNNVAQHIDQFKLLLIEYQQALKNEGNNALAQTQQLISGLDNVNKPPKPGVVDDFINTQCIMDADNSSNSEHSKSEASDKTRETRSRSRSILSEELIMSADRCEQLEMVTNVQEVIDQYDEKVDCMADDIKKMPNFNEQITDSTPHFDDPVMSSTQYSAKEIHQFGDPIMSSTQCPPLLFMSQMAHAKNEKFVKLEQETPHYYVPRNYENFIKRPLKTFASRDRSTNDNTWSKIPIENKLESVLDTKSFNTEEKKIKKTPKRGKKVEVLTPSLKKERKSTFLKKGELVVINAVLSGNIGSLSNAIEAGANLNSTDSQQRTALYIAVEMNRLDMCELLVENGALINAHCGVECNTALHLAVSMGQEAIAHYLLSKGASKTILNIRQQTPSQLAQDRSPLRVLVEKYRQYPRQPSILPRLPDRYNVFIPKTVEIPDSARTVLDTIIVIQPVIDSSTTHIVVNHGPGGVVIVDGTILRAMLGNILIMQLEWLQACIKDGSPIEFSPVYEVSKLRYNNGPVVEGTVSKYRKSREKMEPGLFRGCKFYLLCQRYSASGNDKNLIPDLIKMAEGMVIVREPRFNADDPKPFYAPHLPTPIFVVYDEANSFTIPSKFFNGSKYNLVSGRWIIESIVEFSIKKIP